MIRNPAFEFLRQHKTVEQSTEELITRKLRGRLSQEELLTVFENGITGQYGKVYSLSPDCLMGWISEYESQKNSAKNYLTSSLAPVTMNPNEIWDWEKEANKCYNAFLNGVPADNFHHAVYDNMMIEGRIETNYYMKYLKDEVDWDETEKIAAAKRKVLHDVFTRYKKQGFHTIYFVH